MKKIILMSSALVAGLIAGNLFAGSKNVHNNSTEAAWVTIRGLECQYQHPHYDICHINPGDTHQVQVEAGKTAVINFDSGLVGEIDISNGWTSASIALVDSAGHPANTLFNQVENIRIESKGVPHAIGIAPF